MTARSAELEHDARLEPEDATIAEVQAFVARSRQLGYLGYPELLMAISQAMVDLIDTEDPNYAVAIAGFALRIREEHLV